MAAPIPATSLRDPLLGLFGMHLHHTVECGLGTLLDASEPSLVNLLGQVLVIPAGVIRRHEDQGVVLVPS